MGKLNSNKIVISLGTNLGNKKKNLQIAIKHIRSQCNIIQVSKIYETEPWGYHSKNHFLNMGLVLKWKENPNELLQFLKSIEFKMGREIKNAPKGYQDRIIDLDILLYKNQKVFQKDLIIPHPKIINRRFALFILRDLFQDEIIPVFNKTAEFMLVQTSDNNNVILFNS